MANANAPPDCSPITLSPVPGFTVKSVILTGNSCTLSTPVSSFLATSHLISSSSKTTLDDFDEAAQGAGKVDMPQGMKVFLNVAWEQSGAMPGPPDVSEAAVRRAMKGEDGNIDVDDGKGVKEGVYYVPVAVTGPRQDKDKSGKPSLVFDCVFNAKIKSRCAKDPDFKTYIIELALERVEEKTGVELSRQIGTPNIASKGNLLPRTVYIPNVLLNDSQILVAKAATDTQAPPTSTPTTPKGILKGASSTVTSPPTHEVSKRPLIEEIDSESALTADDAEILEERKALERTIAALPSPRWQWTLDKESVKFLVEVPKLTREAHLSASLNVEERRLLLLIPGIYGLDINLDLSDAQIGKIDSITVPPEPSDQPGSKANQTVAADTLANEFDVKLNLDAEAMRIRGRNAGEALRLKKWVDGLKGRELNVEDAKAEWYIQAGKMAVWA